MPNSIRKPVILIVIFGAVIPIMASLIMVHVVASNFEYYSNSVKAQADEQVRFATISVLRNIETEARLLAISGKMVDYAQTSSIARDFCEVDLILEFDRVLKKSPFIKGITLRDNKNMVLFSHRQLAPDVDRDGDGFTCVKNSTANLFYKITLLFDEHNLSGDSAVNRGNITLSLSQDEIIKTIPGLESFKVPANYKGLSDLVVETRQEKVSGSSTSFALLLFYGSFVFSAIVCFLLLMNDYWPAAAKSRRKPAWYLVLLLCLPLQSFLMLFWGKLHFIWLLDVAFVFILMFILCQVRETICLFLTGGSLGGLLAISFGQLDVEPLITIFGYWSSSN